MTRRTFIVVLAATCAIAFVCVLPGASIRYPGDDTGYAPKQPIAFSHALHAGDLKIDCLYCHSAAERSRHAGIPSPSTCMNCHRFVADRIANVRAAEARAAAESRPVEMPVSSEIMKLYAALGLDRDQKPRAGATPSSIDWVRVHRLPDHASFDHSRHVVAGVACRECHGAVESMERVRQVQDLSMGWCLDCHRQKSRELGPATPALFAGEDCGSCHY